MTNLKIFVSALAAVFILFSTGCKKKGGTIGSDPESPTSPEGPKSPNEEVKTVLPLSIVSDKLKVEFNYVASQNLISEIKQSDGNRETIAYDDKKQPKEFKRFLKNELVYRVDYITNEQGLVTKGIQFKVEAGGKLQKPIGNYQISYNDKQLISEVNWYNSQKELTAGVKYNYDDKQHLTSKRSTDGGKGNFTYTHDNKPGLLKNTAYIQLLSIENEGFYLLNSLSNVSSIQNDDDAAENLKIVSQYNATGYPSTITVTDSKNQNKVYKVTYR